MKQLGIPDLLLYMKNSVTHGDLLLIILATLAVTLPLGLPGWAMAVTAIYLAPIAATAATYAGLYVLNRRKPVR